MPLEMPVEPSTSELLPEDGIEATTPLDPDDNELESPHGFKGVGIVEHLRAADGVRVTSGINSSGTATQSHELSLGRTVVSPELELFLRRGDVEVALGYDDFLGGLEDLKALPLKEQRLRLKNEVFKISIMMTVLS